MSDDQGKLFIIRKVKKVKKGGHHGGSWKIAYADFVTAMMTFFLLMWLLAMMNKYQLEGIAKYFKKPITDAFKHQGVQVNRDVQKDTSVSKGIDSEKTKQKDEELRKKYDELSKTSQRAAEVLSAVSNQDVVGIQTPNASPGAQVFGIQSTPTGLGSSLNTSSGPPSIASQMQVSQMKSLFDMPHDGIADGKASGQQEEIGSPDKNRAEAEEMKKKLEENLKKDPAMSQYKNQLNFIVTSDGLKIELRDLENKTMFSTGKADFSKYSNQIISWLGHQLNVYPNRVVIVGHTDSAQYPSNSYTNWELSADRANATRRELIKNGMNKDKIIRIVGVGDTDLLNSKNKLDPSNRRIEIIIMTDDALKRLTH